MEEGAQVRPEVAGRDSVLLIKEDDIGEAFYIDTEQRNKQRNHVQGVHVQHGGG
jgi:hypothetical protein